MVFQNDPLAIKRYAPFKAPLAAPTSKIDDEPYVCVKLNEQWTPFIIGALECLRWTDIYKGTPEEIYYAALEATQLFLAVSLGNMECEGGTMTKLRQNPDESCLLEISYDNGVSWDTAFDYSLCMSKHETINNYYNDMSIANTDITNMMITYNGDILNVAPDWEYTPGRAEFVDEAMCWAVREWVSLCCDYAIRKKEQDVEKQKDLVAAFADALEGVAFVAGVMAGLAIWPVTLGAAAIALGLAGSNVEVLAELIQADVSAFKNDEAKDLVACTIYGVMRGETPSFENWTTALEGHSFSGDAYDIANVCHAFMQDEATFVAYMRGLSDMVDAAELGTDLGCPCDGDWYEKWYFDTAEGEEAFVIYDNDEPDWTVKYGHYNLGDGGWVADEEIHDDKAMEIVQIQINFPARTLTRVRVDFDYLEGFVPIGDQGETALKIYTLSPTWKSALTIPFAWLSPGVQNKAWAGVRTNVTGVVILLRCSYDKNIPPSTYGDGHAIINRVVLEGDGINPFE